MQFSDVVGDDCGGRSRMAVKKRANPCVLNGVQLAAMECGIESYEEFVKGSEWRVWDGVV